MLALTPDDLKWCFVLVVPFWLLLLHRLASHGWRVLASQYPATTGSDGRRLWLRSARVGPTDYHGVLVFTVGSRGMRVGVLPLFSFFHPAVFIPWEDVTSEYEEGLLIDRVVLRLSKCPDVQVRIFPPFARKLVELSNGGMRPISAAS